MRVMWAGTPAVATGSSRRRNGPTTSSAAGTGTRMALWVRPLLVPAGCSAAPAGRVLTHGLACRPWPPLSAMSPEDVGEKGGDGHLDLLVGARTGVPVRPPPAEPGRVPEPSALEVLKGGFDDQLRTEQLEAQVLVGISAAAAAHRPRPRVGAGQVRPLRPRMVGAGVPVGGQHLDQGPPLVGREGADDADVAQLVAVVQAEHEGL